MLKEIKGHKETKEHKVRWVLKVFKDFLGSRDHKVLKDLKDLQEHKDLKELQVLKAPLGFKVLKGL